MERWDHDTERDDFYQEEVERKKEEVAGAKKDKEIWHNRVSFVNVALLFK